MIRVLTLTLVVALLSSTTQTSADDQIQSPVNYLILKGGMCLPGIFSHANDTKKNSLDSKTGFAGELAMGHHFLPMLAVELGAGFFRGNGSMTAQAGELMLQFIPLTASVKVFLPFRRFEPYGLAGIGAYISDMEVKGSSSYFQDSKEITYGLHVGGGFNINLPQNIFAGLEGKYLWAEPAFRSQQIRLNGFISTANVGYCF